MPIFPAIGTMLLGSAGAASVGTAGTAALGMGATALAAGGTAYALNASNTGAKSANSARLDMMRAASGSDSSLGNLSPGETATSASKKMFREGLYFTSPTGLGTGGESRGRSRLFGA